MAETAIARPWTEVLMAAAITAAAVFLVLYFPERDDPSGAVVGAVFTLGAAALGLAAIAHVRPLSTRTAGEHVRLAALALALGIALGAANLVANRSIAMLDPAIYGGMIDRWALYSPWSMVVAEPLIEEIAFRLVLLGGIAYVVGLVAGDRRKVFAIALGVSALVFGLAHVFYAPSPPVGGAVGLLYAVGVVLKSGAAGLLLGWVFWRWGLPYSFACHGTANAAHLVLAPGLF